MSLKEQVKQILEDRPETRNSDITLMVEVWKRFHPAKIKGLSYIEPNSIIEAEVRPGGLYPVVSNIKPCVQLEDLYDLPREDNIKRIRAAFNAKGLYWPTELKIAIGRGLQENEWREKLGYPKVEDTKQPTKQESYTGFISSNLRPDVQAERDQNEKQPGLEI